MGLDTSIIFDVYCKSIRSVLELAVPSRNSDLTSKLGRNIEKIQKISFSIILGTIGYKLPLKQGAYEMTCQFSKCSRYKRWCFSMMRSCLLPTWARVWIWRSEGTARPASPAPSWYESRPSTQQLCPCSSTPPPPPSLSLSGQRRCSGCPGATRSSFGRDYIHSPWCNW